MHSLWRQQRSNGMVGVEGLSTGQMATACKELRHELEAVKLNAGDVPALVGQRKQPPHSTQFLSPSCHLLRLTLYL
eukprot:535792-Pelagomonas_calceolata.AAC.7